eukprot:119452-Ditylum_brightwellii.AAC.1
MPLTFKTPLYKANNSALVVAPVGSTCLEISQWVATLFVRSAIDEIDLISPSSLAKSASLYIAIRGFLGYMMGLYEWWYKNVIHWQRASKMGLLGAAIYPLNLITAYP